MAWRADDVTDSSGAPPAAFVLPASYVSQAPGPQHVVYLGFIDNHIHELSRDNTGWHTDDLTAATGAPEPLPDHLLGYVFGAQSSQHVIYVGASDEHIHELWSDGNGWHTDDLTAATGAPLAGAGAMLAYPFEAQHTQHVFYQDPNTANTHIHELWWDNSGWHTDDLTAATGAPPPLGGYLVGYAFEAQGTLHVFYIGSPGYHIHELWRDNTGWHTDDLTAATGAPATTGPMAAYVFAAQGTQHVIFNAGSGAEDHLHELWWDNSGRHTADLTAATGAPPGDGAFVGYGLEPDGTQHVIYDGIRDQHVHELWWDNNGRHIDDLTAATGAPPVRSGGGTPGGVGLIGYVLTAQGTPHVFYISYLDNHIHELWRGPGPTTPASPTATTSSRTAPPAAAAASAHFVGHWHVHGATLDITPTAATFATSWGPCGPQTQRSCRETDALTVVSGDDTQLTLQLTATSYTDDNGASVPNPTAPAIGDSLRLDWQAPGLLKTTILRGFHGWTDGNPYWCGAGISQANMQLCGA